MALTKAKKAQKVETLAAELQGSTSAIVGTFTKLTVSQDFELRQKVREAGGRYRVLKNKLASRAAQGTEIAGALENLKGVSSVAYTSGDPVALAKALSTWVKENAEFTFKLGIIDGKLINVAEVQALATMPGKSELYAKLLFLINAPAQRLATVLSAAGRDLAIVVNQGVEKGKFAPGEVAAAAMPAAEAPVAEASVVEAPVAEAPAAQAVAEAPVAQAVAEAPVAETSVAEAPVVEAPGTPDAEAPVLESQAEAAAGEAPVEGQ